MKTKPSPKSIAKYISLLFFAAIIIQSLTAQNLNNLNGRIVYENNGKYFSMHQ